jgi:paraquat-inducible protein A
VAAASAAAASLLRCHGCAKLSRAGQVPAGHEARCSRCGTGLHLRKPNSLARTWAFVIAAVIFYIPANLYPIMTVERLGKAESDTILSGIQALFAAGWYPVGILIFFASITVPMLKLIGLTYLLLSVRRRSRWRPRDRTVLYRLIEYVGRWSMIDMFVTSLLVALVKLGAVATIVPGVGATCFAAVVVLTMFAAMSFDPRLIWDSMEEAK